MQTRHGSIRRIVAGGIVAMISATMVAWPAAAQDEEPSMCTMFDIDAVSAATGQEYEPEPQRASPGMCRWATTSDPNHGLTLAFDPNVPYGRLREEAVEVEDLEIGGMPAFVTPGGVGTSDRRDEAVYIDIDGAQALYVSLRAGIDEIPDHREQAITLAETVVAALPGPTFSIPELAPPPLEDVVWSEPGRGSGQGDEVAELIGDALDPLLEALGVDYSGVSLLTTQSNLDDGSQYDFIGFLRSIRIDGAEQAAIEAGLEGFLESVAGGAELERIALGGKDVIRAQTGSAPEGLHVYVTGDTVHLIELSDLQVVEALLQALP